MQLGSSPHLLDEPALFFLTLFFKKAEVDLLFSVGSAVLPQHILVLLQHTWEESHEERLCKHTTQHASEQGDNRPETDDKMKRKKQKTTPHTPADKLKRNYLV